MLIINNKYSNNRYYVLMLLKDRNNCVSPRAKLGEIPFTYGSAIRRPWWFTSFDTSYRVSVYDQFHANTTHKLASSILSPLFSLDERVSSPPVFSDPARCVSNFHGVNFRHVFASCCIHFRLHILTRVAMQNVLSSRNHVS